MNKHRDLDTIFEEQIRNWLQRSHVNLSQPAEESIVHEALFQSKAFIRTRPPVIAITGITATGKSSLVNALFGEQKVREGLIADTTHRIVTIKFQSGLLIYDTPGGGGDAALENITRAFLGLPQLLSDPVTNHPLLPVDHIPTIDAHNYNKAVEDEQIMYRKHEDFMKPDLFLFVVNVRAGTLKRDDKIFYWEIVRLNRPVIVIVNQIDDIEPSRVKAALELIKKELDQQAIEVSAKERLYIQKVALEIQKNLPIECSQALGQTVDEKYKKTLKTEQITLYSLAAAVRFARHVGEEQSVEPPQQIAAAILALYSWIVNQYALSEAKLESVGFGFADLIHTIEQKMKMEPYSNDGMQFLVLVGSVVGIAIASIATAGTALPIALGAMGGGIVGGTSLGACLGLFSGLFRQSSVLDLKTNVEVEKLQKFISTSNRFNTISSFLAFGIALSLCCEKLEHGIDNVDFLQIFQLEYDRVTHKLQEFTTHISKSPYHEESLIKNIYAKLDR